MGRSRGKDSNVSHSAPVPKVHGLMCEELKKLVDEILQILPSLESARPGFRAGIQVLCSVNLDIEKAKLLIDNCTDTSKLYLAITGESVKRRCERIRSSLQSNLCQLQSMVPLDLARQVSGLLHRLEKVQFVLNPSEEEAGKSILGLLQTEASASGSSENLEYEVLRSAAVKLNITSPRAYLIEKRSLKKLLEKIGDSDERKRSILLYLQRLLNRYGNLLISEMRGSTFAEECRDSLQPSKLEYDTHSDEGVDECTSLRRHSTREKSQVETRDVLEPPKQFICPLSLQLMCDPVVIGSGETFERAWIQKWFDEGHYTCPKTDAKLSHLGMTPNASMRDLISSWCKNNGVILRDPEVDSFCSTSCPLNMLDSNSICSLDSTLCRVSSLLLQASCSTHCDANDSSFASSLGAYSSDSSFGKSFMTATSDSSWSPSLMKNNYELLLKLTSPPFESQHRAAEDVKHLIEEHSEACDSLIHNGYLDAVMGFLKDASMLSDVKALETGAQILWDFVRTSRDRVPFLSDTFCETLALLLDSGIQKEALAILVRLSDDFYYKSRLVLSKVVPPVIQILDSKVQKPEILSSAVTILYNLSSLTEAMACILSSRCVTKLVNFLGDSRFAGSCVKILQSLALTEQGRDEIADTDGCIAALVELLDNGSLKVQEHAVAVLLSLCSHKLEHCQLVMKESVIPSLVSVSVNGNQSAKENGMKLLRYLRDLRKDHSQKRSVRFDQDLPVHIEPVCDENKQECSEIFRQVVDMEN